MVSTIVVGLTKNLEQIREPKKYLLNPSWQKNKRKISFFLSTIQQKKYFYVVDFHATKTTVVKELISYESIKILAFSFHIICSIIQTTKEKNQIFLFVAI